MGNIFYFSQWGSNSAPVTAPATTVCLPSSVTTKLHTSYCLSDTFPCFCLAHWPRSTIYGSSGLLLSAPSPEQLHNPCFPTSCKFWVSASIHSSQPFAICGEFEASQRIWLLSCCGLYIPCSTWTSLFPLFLSSYSHFLLCIPGYIWSPGDSRPPHFSFAHIFIFLPPFNFTTLILW